MSILRISKLQQTSRGYVALMMVLITGAITVAIALSLLLGGTDAGRSATVSVSSVKSRAASSACVEEALQQIHDDTGFTGTNNITLVTGNCSYTVTNTGGNTRLITANSEIQNTVRKVEVHATIETSNISITSWQEVI